MRVDKFCYVHMNNVCCLFPFCRDKKEMLEHTCSQSKEPAQCKGTIKSERQMSIALVIY